MPATPTSCRSPARKAYSTVAWVCSQTMRAMWAAATLCTLRRSIGSVYSGDWKTRVLRETSKTMSRSALVPSRATASWRFRTGLRPAYAALWARCRTFAESSGSLASTSTMSCVEASGSWESAMISTAITGSSGGWYRGDRKCASTRRTSSSTSKRGSAAAACMAPDLGCEIVTS